MTSSSSESNKVEDIIENINNNKKTKKRQLDDKHEPSPYYFYQEERIRCTWCLWTPSKKNRYPKSAMMRHIKNFHLEGGWRCQQCTFVARYSLAELKIHQSRKHEQKKLRCEMCPFRTSTHRQLKEHTKNQHCNTTYESRQKYPCKQCEKIFLSAQNRRRHTKHVHEGVSHKIDTPGAFACTQCDSRYSRMFSLRRHVAKVHEKKKEEDRRCFICNHVTQGMVAMKRHMRQEHGEIGKLSWSFARFKI